MTSAAGGCDPCSGLSQPISDPSTAALLMQLRECLCREVARTLLGPTCRCYIAWGAALPIQDGCSCQCGLDGEHNGDAWVKLDALEPDLGVGFGGNDVAGWCATGWTAAVTMGVYRCVPVAADEDVLPEEDVTDTSLNLLSDMAALWRVLQCCPCALGDGLRVVGWTPIDASGGCAGSSLSIQIPLSGTTGCP